MSMMSHRQIDPPADPAALSRPIRYALVVAGVACVAIGAVGAVVPGLPTTIFLILATGCFTRSCPWLERRLIHENRLFRPFLAYLRPDVAMPRRARVAAIAVMWVAVSVSVATILATTDSAIVLPAAVVLSAAIGTACIWRAGDSGRATGFPSSA